MGRGVKVRGGTARGGSARDRGRGRPGRGRAPTNARGAERQLVYGLLDVVMLGQLHELWQKVKPANVIA